MESDEKATTSRTSKQVPTDTDVGKKVTFFINQDKKKRHGTLRYIGTPEFAPGTWCGVELDDASGKNNGSVHGIRYFTCPPNHGLFVPMGRVEIDHSGRNRTVSRLPMEKFKKSKTPGASTKSGAFFPHSTLPRSSSNPSLNIGNYRDRSATLTPSVRVSPNSSPSKTNQQKSSITMTPNRMGPSRPLTLTTATKRKSTSSINISSANDRTYTRRPRKTLASLSDTCDMVDESSMLRVSNSCCDINQLGGTFPRTSTPYDSEDSQSQYSSTSDFSRRDSISDSDATACSSSVSPDMEISLFDNGDNAFLLTPHSSSRILISPETSPYHRTTYGLTTIATNLVESSRNNGGTTNEYRGPSPEINYQQQKKYQNYQNGCTLDHPLSNEITAQRTYDKDTNELLGSHSNDDRPSDERFRLQSQLDHLMNQQGRQLLPLYGLGVTISLD
jgi:hypothetical protein